MFDEIRNQCSSKLIIFFIFLFILGCNTSENKSTGQNTNLALEWGKHRLLSSLLEISEDSESILPENVLVRVKTIDADLPQIALKPEGYHILVRNGKITVTGFDAAGAMYGCLKLVKYIEERGIVPESYEFTDAPVMKLRGTCILLMKLGTYNYPITPEAFPFFYDKKLWLKYLDFLAENRFNYIAFWNGHPFDYFVKLDKYPEAQEGMKPGLIEKNHEMLTWLCEEGTKRNVRFLFQFYNIHTSVYFQKAHNLPEGISEPIPLLEDYTSYTIESFVKEFPQVGLYITPGEAINQEYTDQWINTVIFPAITRTGNTPPVFDRGWFFDLDHARKIVGNYPDLYFERKFNVEMIADTLPNPENKVWADLNGNLIVNIHMAANLEPFRWNPPSYIQKCMQNAHINGSNGLHLYPRKSWRWPYGSDLDASKLQWERDALWFEAWGRYAWNPYLNRSSEHKYWLNRLTVKFENKNAAKHFLSSFELGSDVLPALQRLLWLGHDNHTVLSAGAKLWHLENAEGIPFLPLKNSIRIPEYLRALKNRKTPIRDNPIEFLQIKRTEAQNSLREARLAARLASRNKPEAYSYQNDALATSLVIDFYYHKLQAAKFKIQYENNIDTEKNKRKFLTHLENSVDTFRELTDLTTKTYESLSDVPAKHPAKLKTCPYHWRDILPIFEKELEIYENETIRTLDSSFFKPSLIGLAGIWYSDPGLKIPVHPYATNTLRLDWSNPSEEMGRNWSARWFGFLLPLESGTVIMYCDSDRGLTVKSEEKVLLEWSGKKERKSVKIPLQKNNPYPIEIIYDHEGGEEGYLQIEWQRQGHKYSEHPPVLLLHSPAQKQQMDRVSILNELN